MGRTKRPILDETLKTWIEEFNVDSTKRVYLAALRNFKELLGITDLGNYIKSNPDVNTDMRKFLKMLNGKPNKTVHAFSAGVKVFFQDHDIEIKENNWRKLRRRGFIPRASKAETRDKKPTKEILKKILNYADIKARSLTLFLISSGCRIGETLQLEESDFAFESIPPRVHIRGDITKKGVGERTAYFSYEARDAIKDWLNIKNSLNKKTGENYSSTKVFPFSSNNARFMWNMACDKAGVGQTDKRTGRRIYHLHGLRKYFRSNIKLDLDITHALMGHSEYLDDAYLRLEDEGEIGKAYLRVMGNVSVYSETTEALEKAETVEQENKELKRRIGQLETMLLDLKEAVDNLAS